jgi:hypothetical protein
MYGGWAALFDESLWFERNRASGSFGNVTNLKTGEDSFWGRRLAKWVEAFLEENPRRKMDDMYVLCSPPTMEESLELSGMRALFNAHIRKCL